jgi:uncharacterized protein (DUF2236 family)
MVTTGSSRWALSWEMVVRPGTFTDRSIIRRVAAEPQIVLGAGTALLLGLLPEPIRAAYGLPWTTARQRALDLTLGTIKVAARVTPGAVRRLPMRASVPAFRRFRWRRYQGRALDARP